MIVRAALSFTRDSATSVQSIEKDYQEVAAGPAVYIPPIIVSIPSELFVELKIKGSNSLLIYEDETILASYRASSIGFMIITVLSLVFFLVSVYFHKMIGLETIQILQFFYFITMIVDPKNTTFLKSLNVLKFTAFGGYSDYELFYGDISDEAESLTSSSVHKSFLFVGLMKYFFLNVNLSLFIPLLILTIFSFHMVLKFKKRFDYLKKRLQGDKDVYTVRRRTTQWVYDHCVFPFVNIFSMIAFFCTILELQSTSFQSSMQDPSIEGTFAFVHKTSFVPNLIFVFLTFLMVAYEVFASYEQYRHS